MSVDDKLDGWNSVDEPIGFKKAPPRDYQAYNDYLRGVEERRMHDRIWNSDKKDDSSGSSGNGFIVIAILVLSAISYIYTNFLDFEGISMKKNKEFLADSSNYAKTIYSIDCYPSKNKKQPYIAYLKAFILLDSVNDYIDVCNKGKKKGKWAYIDFKKANWFHFDDTNNKNLYKGGWVYREDLVVNKVLKTYYEMKRPR